MALVNWKLRLLSGNFVVLMLKNKGAEKTDWVIDPDYQGEIGFLLHNGMTMSRPQRTPISNNYGQWQTNKDKSLARRKF